jgi:voltage-gated potassium channel
MFTVTAKLYKQGRLIAIIYAKISLSPQPQGTDVWAATCRNYVFIQTINRGDKTMFKKRVFEIIEKSKGGDIPSLVFDVFMMILIILNVVAVTAASFDNFANAHPLLLHRFEVVSIVIFSIEYLLRLWTAKYMFPNSKHPHIRLIFSFGGLVDLVAILPFFIPFVYSTDLRSVKILRLFRVFRIFKLSRYSKSMLIIVNVLKNEKEKLLATVILTTTMLFVASTIMYYAEHSSQPEIFQNILETVWWAISAMFYIWYGELYPISLAGKICGGIIAMCDMMLVALPVGIISSGFVDELSKQNKICPHCGKEIN